jgi:hypothetical protein
VANVIQKTLKEEEKEKEEQKLFMLNHVTGCLW